MKSLTGALTKHFIIAGFLPGLAFTVINRILLAMALPTRAQEPFSRLLNSLPSEIEGFSYVLISVLIGALLMSCNVVLIRLYEGYPFRRLPLLLSRQRACWNKTYGRVTKLRAKLEEWEKELETGKEARGHIYGLEEEPDREPFHGFLATFWRVFRWKTARQTTESSNMTVHPQDLCVAEAELRYESVIRAVCEEEARVWGPDGKGWYIPYDKRRLMPTRLGNAFAVMEEYPFHHYNMDATLYWPRMLLVIPEKYDNEIGNLKMSIDFALNLSALLYLIGTECVAMAIILQNWRFAIGTTVALAFGYLLYGNAVLWTREMGTLIASCFDLFRGDLQKAMIIGPKSALDKERNTWLSLAQFLASADSRHLKRQDH